MEPIPLELPRKSRQKKEPIQRQHEVGEYLKVDRFEVVETYRDQEPRYVAITEDGERLPIPHTLSALTGPAIGVELRYEGFPGLFSNDEQNPFIWVPVMYDVRESGRTTRDTSEE